MQTNNRKPDHSFNRYRHVARNVIFKRLKTFICTTSPSHYHRLVTTRSFTKPIFYSVLKITDYVLAVTSNTILWRHFLRTFTKCISVRNSWKNYIIIRIDVMLHKQNVFPLQWHQIIRVVGVWISVEKTREMRLGHTGKENMYEKLLWKLNRWKNFVKHINRKMRHRADITHRITKANQAFGTLKNIWKSTKLGLSKA